VPRRHQHGTRALPSLGVHRPAPREFPDPVPHEPGWHAPDGVLRQATRFSRTHSSTPGPFPTSTKVVGIATGHHGVARSGRMLIIDPAVGRHEADGVIQEIPGWGVKVQPKILDPLVDGVWPQFLHPFSAEREVFPGIGQADSAIALGRLPGRCLRQHAAPEGNPATRCSSRSDPQDCHAPGRGRPH